MLFSLLFGSWSASNALLPKGLCQVDVYVLGGVLNPQPHKTIAYSLLGIGSSNAFKVGSSLFPPWHEVDALSPVFSRPLVATGGGAGRRVTPPSRVVVRPTLAATTETFCLDYHGGCREAA